MLGHRSLEHCAIGENGDWYVAYRCTFMVPFEPKTDVSAAGKLPGIGPAGRSSDLPRISLCGEQMLRFVKRTCLVK